MNRKDALKRFQGLRPRVEEHLEKIRDHPASQDRPHWVKEVESWARQIEALLPHVGKRTAADWNRDIENWKGQLGN